MIKKITNESGLDESVIRSKLGPELKTVKPAKVIKPKTKMDKYEIAQRNLVYYMLRSPEVIKMYNTKVTYMPLKEYRLLAREIKMFYSDHGFINEADLINYVECDEEVLKTISKVENANLKENYSIEEIDDYIMTIKNHNIKSETARLKEQMKKELDPLNKAKIAQKIIDLKKESDYV